MKIFDSFPLIRQADTTDCGPACLAMVTKHYGQRHSIQQLRALMQADKTGVSLLDISQAAEELGFHAAALKLPLEGKADQVGLDQVPLPAIVHWQEGHFVVVHRIKGGKIHIADPAKGKFQLPAHQFARHWKKDSPQGIALILEPGSALSHQEKGKKSSAPLSIRNLFAIVYQDNKRLFWQIGIGAIILGVIQFFLPFLTQTMVDIGVVNQDLTFIYIILAGQFVLYAMQALTTVLQNRMILFLGTRTSVGLISRFLDKLLALPMTFFESRYLSDLIKRIQDHSRIEEFLTSSIIQVFFSFMVFLSLGTVLFLFHPLLFGIFVLGSLLYVFWIYYFQRRRAKLDYLQFEQLRDHHHSLVEMIEGMRDIRLNQAGMKHKRDWQQIQTRLFDVNWKYLTLSQVQEVGGGFIHHAKNTLIMIVGAIQVVQGGLSLGMLLAIQFIIGQLNGPLMELLRLIRSYQDATLSLSRLNEVELEMPDPATSLTGVSMAGQTISVQDISFSYSHTTNLILSRLSFDVPFGQTVALVGRSGEGKTSLLKVLLGFYQPIQGRIAIGNHPLSPANKENWRQASRAVLQDGYIYSKTILENILEGSEEVNMEKVQTVMEVSCLDSFLEELPKGLDTTVGQRGLQLSEGQKQRLLLARALYHEPDYLFLDEATNALDADTERQVMENLRRYMAGKTVFIVAHRLSTVRQADMILVLENGQIAERGTHQELLQLGGVYAQLVSFQLGRE